MKLRIWILVVLSGLSLCCVAQQALPPADIEIQEPPEEVLIMGDRSLMQMRLQLQAAERRTYDLFNTFNDEKRFKVSCSINQPTGTRFDAQICQPEFIIRASVTHGRAFLESYSGYLNSSGEFQPTVQHQPFEVVVAKLQPEYQRKLEQIARQHPEFLQAIIEMEEMKAQYEAALRQIEAGR